MRKLLVSLASLLMMLVALSGSAAFGASNGTDRPWKASGSAEGIVTPGAPVTTHTEGTSTNTHLGRSTFVVDGVCLNEDCSSDTFTFTIVAANGDTLRASGAGDTATFTGGTGRFAGASGTVTTTTPTFAFTDPLHFHFTFTQTGTISY